MIAQAADIIKNPYVLVFLDLQGHSAYSERELETAIIGKLEEFLLELGKGFLFGARQRRFTFDNDHVYVDQVFYNRLLHCYVLLDFYKKLILDFVTKFGSASRRDIDQLLWDKLSDALDEEQKRNKISNLLNI